MPMQRRDCILPLKSTIYSFSFGCIYTCINQISPRLGIKTEIKGINVYVLKEIDSIFTNIECSVTEIRIGKYSGRTYHQIMKFFLRELYSLQIHFSKVLNVIPISDYMR